MNLFDTIRKYPEMFLAFLEHSETTITVITDPGQVISACNPRLTRSLYIPEKPVGRKLSDIFCPLEDDAPLSLILSTLPGAPLPQMLKICYTETFFRCCAFETDGGILLLGDHVGSTDSDVLEGMSLLNNEMSTLSRELSRKNRELEAANRKITELVRTDSLTGLSNRRYFQERYEEAFSQAKRNNTPLSVIMMDLDHFKHINDTYGHEAGDTVLRALGSTLMQQARPGDLPARFGGEEFILFLPQTVATGALRLAERVRKTTAGMDMLENGTKVTISAGIAQMRPEDSGDSLIRRSDEALYRAKRHGRNRSMVSHPPETNN